MMLPAQFHRVFLAVGSTDMRKFINGLSMKEIYPEISVGELQSITEPKLNVASDLKEIEF